MNPTNVMTPRLAFLLLLLCLAGVGASDNAPVEKEEWGCKWSEHWPKLADGTTDDSGKPTPPKEVHDSPISWPGDTAHRTGSGVPIVEAVVDADGKVVDVRIVRPITWEPPWPEFDKAIIDAIRSWRYTPAKRGDRPVPACVSITIMIHWR